MKKSRTWYYVSYYEEYPIYEPAEGGYYYAGLKLVNSYRFGSLTRARKFLKSLAADYGMSEVSSNRYMLYSNYIGESEQLCIETVSGKQEKGYKLYN